MRNRRYFLPAGSAVAAAVLFAALFVVPTRQSTVNAATILSALRQTTHHGLRITLEDVRTKDLDASGRVSLVFEQPFTVAGLISGTEAEPDPRAIYCDMHVRFAEGRAELGGLALHAAAGLSPEAQWAFIQTDDITPLIQEVGPVAGLLAPLLRGGLLLDLEEAWGGASPFGHEAAPAGVVHTQKREVTVRTGDGEIVTQTIEAEVEAAYDANGAAFEVAAGVSGDSLALLGDDDLETAVRSFLSGDASAEEFEQVIAELEQVAGQVTVTEVEPGLYVLAAQEFGQLLERGTGGDELLADARLEIAYRHGVGVDWLTVSDLGELRGVVTIEFMDSPAPTDTIRREDYIVEGVTTVLDVGGLMRAFEGFNAPAADDSR